MALTALLIAAAVITSGPSRELARKLPPPTPASPIVSELSDAEATEQATALLAAIDRAASPEQWRALGPKAEALLAAVADDAQALPSRRARAVDGLAALGGSRERLSRLAQVATEPFIVRLAAVRGLGVVVPAAELPVAMKALLGAAGDSRIRAAAAEVLATHVKVACQAVEAQLAREASDGREQFQRAVEACRVAR